jgi:NAD(P) transhydrogenase subunit alpha
MRSCLLLLFIAVLSLSFVDTNSAFAEDKPEINKSLSREPLPPPPLPEDRARGEDAKSFSRIQVLVASLTVFTLAVLVGFEIIAKVPPTLHTPLMSGSNAISGITIVGALLAAGNGQGGFASWLGVFAIAMAFINVVGGFLVTHRMLLMFKKK